MVKLVTMAKITLNRPGSIGRGGFQRIVSDLNGTHKTFNIVLDRSDPGDVLAKVKELSLANGESENGVERLTVATPFGAPDGVICFNERFEPYGTQFGQLYAESEVFPVLEIDGRYFRLNEITVSP